VFTRPGLDQEKKAYIFGMVENMFLLSKNGKPKERVENVIPGEGAAEVTRDKKGGSKEKNRSVSGRELKGTGG